MGLRRRAHIRGHSNINNDYFVDLPSQSGWKRGVSASVMWIDGSPKVPIGGNIPEVESPKLGLLSQGFWPGLKPLMTILIGFNIRGEKWGFDEQKYLHQNPYPELDVQFQTALDQVSKHYQHTFVECLKGEGLSAALMLRQWPISDWNSNKLFVWEIWVIFICFARSRRWSRYSH